MAQLNRIARKLPSVFLAFAIGILFACASITADRRPEVAAALQRYSDFMLRMDNAGIAGLFADDSELKNTGQDPIYGPKAVRALFDTFKDYKVLAYQIHADSTQIRSDIAVQSGSYRQKVMLPSKQTIEVSGRFDAVWTRMADGRWLIHRMLTTPDQPKPAKASR